MSRALSEIAACLGLQRTASKMEILREARAASAITNLKGGAGGGQSVPPPPPGPAMSRRRATAGFGCDAAADETTPLRMPVPSVGASASASERLYTAAPAGAGLAVGGGQSSGGVQVLRPPTVQGRRRLIGTPTGDVARSFKFDDSDSDDRDSDSVSPDSPGCAAWKRPRTGTAAADTIGAVPERRGASSDGAADHELHVWHRRSGSGMHWHAGGVPIPASMPRVAPAPLWSHPQIGGRGLSMPGRLVVMTPSTMPVVSGLYPSLRLMPVPLGVHPAVAVPMTPVTAGVLSPPLAPPKPHSMSPCQWAPQ
jgi:hypothetical protein